MSAEKVQIKFLGGYTLSETIGQGSYSKVYLAYKHPNHDKFAIKRIEKQGMGDHEIESVHREIEVM